MQHTIHQRLIVQQKFDHKYHKYEVHDREILHHYRFKGRTGIVSSHAKQDNKIQDISNRLYALDTNNENCFTLTKKNYQFMNKLEENLNFPSLRQKSGKEI